MHMHTYAAIHMRDICVYTREHMHRRYVVALPQKCGRRGLHVLVLYIQRKVIMELLFTYF